MNAKNLTNFQLSSPKISKVFLLLKYFLFSE